MNSKLIAKLERFFEGLDRDLCFGLAAALAEKCGVQSADIFRVYENWQIKGQDDNYA